jgi:antitoxin CcdA
MGRYTTVSAKVRKDIVDDARRLGVNISQVIRRAVEEEVRRQRLLKLEEELRREEKILSKIDANKIIQLIREDRESR